MPTNHLLYSEITQKAASSKPYYLGCFTDKADRDLTFSAAAVTSVNIASCSAACSGYKYMGLQDGSQCFCGNTYAKYGESNACGMTCNGDGNLVCGGVWANSIFGKLWLKLLMGGTLIQ
jgi:hypothetical protein